MTNGFGMHHALSKAGGPHHFVFNGKNSYKGLIIVR